MNLKVFGNNPGKVKSLVESFGRTSPVSLASNPSVLVSVYNFAEGGSYGLALKKLREHIPPGNAYHPLVKGFPRPLSLKETLQERVNDYNTLTTADGTARTEAERKQLFLRYFYSCTGIHYNPDNDEFMLVPVCDRLISLDSAFNEPFIDIPYNTFQGIKLNRTHSKYDSLLSQSEVLEHHGWRALVEDDHNLLQAYTDIAFSLKSGKLMTFWLRDKNNVSKPELRAVCVYSIVDNSSAGGYSLNYFARFLIKAPFVAP